MALASFFNWEKASLAVIASRGPSSEEEEDSVETIGGLLEEAIESLEEGVEVPQPTKDSRDKQRSARYRFIKLLSHIGRNAEVATWRFIPTISPIVGIAVANFYDHRTDEEEAIVGKSVDIIIADRIERGVG